MKTDKPTNQDSALITRQEVADFLGVTTRSVDRWMQDGILPYYKLGKRTVRFKRDDVIKQLDENFRFPKK